MTAAEFNIRIANTFGDDWRIFTRKCEHFVCHIHANNAAFRADNLRCDKTDFSAAGPKVQNGFTFANITGRIAAAIITIEDILRNNFKILRVIIDWAAKCRFHGLRARAIAILHTITHIGICRVYVLKTIIHWETSFT